eukprot:COSAG02_NODE_11142_length_1784_cov_1.554896_2_plen_91_part_00
MEEITEISGLPLTAEFAAFGREEGVRLHHHHHHHRYMAVIWPLCGCYMAVMWTLCGRCAAVMRPWWPCGWTRRFVRVAVLLWWWCRVGAV